MERPGRVVIRPPPIAAAASATPPPRPQPPSHLSSPPPPPAAVAADGVVVVGFLGSTPTTDATHLINRILDANVFGSGNLASDLLFLPSSHRRRITYHHDADKGIVYLHLSPSPPLLDPAAAADDLRPVLLMFSVCHVIVFLHEGSRFDTQLLKKFRVLQSAKHALAPFVRSQISPASAAVSRPAAPRAASVSPPGRRGAVTNRNASSISLMSGSGSHPSVLPGQCTPVMLFVFVDDFLDGPSLPLNAEDLPDASINQSGIVRPGSTLKGSGSVVMLARPISKTEGSFRKKLHSSLDAQIRFLIKKCRTLVAEPGHGSRAGGNTGSFPLFSLDTSRVVTLLDRSANRRGESLEFVTGLFEEVLDSKVGLDIFMLENHCQVLNNEDIQSIKDFVYRQSDSLRGRGSLPSNTNSSSVAGVGMLAAAAAAAAASAGAGKPLSAPKLPTLENWLSSSTVILETLLAVKHDFVDENGNTRRLPSQQVATEIQDELISRPGTDAVDAAVSCLESSRGLTMKFSTSWCQRALPAAKDIYLKELPDCYPTALHKAHLEKALNAFQSMVKGPAVQLFAKKLEDECISMWESGRQLCDAISLTGKPCMHQRHNVNTCDFPLVSAGKQHSSGYVFLHACACGRSRRLREDPFDFDNANIAFNCFPNCEDLLPTLALPRGSIVGSLPPSSWSLVRVGGSRYYKPSKGLLQIGFCPTDKFLLKWTISLETQKGICCLPNAFAAKCNAISSAPDSKTLTTKDEPVKKSDATQIPIVQSGGSENERKHSEVVSVEENKSINKSINFGKGLPSFTMKKPFSEVVAGTVVADSTFPVLQHRKQTKLAPGKGGRQMIASDQSDIHVQLADDQQGSQKSEQVSVQVSSHKSGASCSPVADPYLQIGSNIVPVNMLPGGKTKTNTSAKEVIIYVGFEHECPYGHRFLLSPEHLNELHSSYSTSDNSHSTENSERKHVGAKKDLHEKVVPCSSETNGTSVDRMKKGNRRIETTTTNSRQQDSFTVLPRPGLEKVQFVHRHSETSDYKQELENLSHVRLDDDSSAFSLLNRNLPVFMNCPHCRSSAKQEQQKIKFASTISQLQRIYLVTPAFPTVLATRPLIQFEESCLPASTKDREKQSRFTLGCRVILPPESFLTVRLPFVYGVQIDDGSLHPLNYLENQPELTAWLVKGTTLQVVSIGPNIDDDIT